MQSMERSKNERLGLYGPLDSSGQRTQTKTWVPYLMCGHHLYWRRARVRSQPVLHKHEETHPGLRHLFVRGTHRVVG